MRRQLSSTIDSVAREALVREKFRFKKDMVKDGQKQTRLGLSHIIGEQGDLIRVIPGEDLQTIHLLSNLIDMEDEHNEKRLDMYVRNHKLHAVVDEKERLFFADENGQEVEIPEWVCRKSTMLRTVVKQMVSDMGAALTEETIKMILAEEYVESKKEAPAVLEENGIEVKDG